MTHKTRDHMPVESPDHISAESRDHVLATYRQIADRFRLGGSNAARTKVKRAGWTSEPANHPADPLRIRVPREVWEQATERPHHKSRRESRERRDGKPRDPPSQHQDTPDINGFEMAVKAIFEMAVKAIKEQLERERGRADASEIRVRELTAELETARARMMELREARAAAEAKTEAAESRVDDLMVQAGKLAQAQARADLLQVEVDRSRAEADRLRQEFAAAGAKPARRRWLPWRRRGG